MSDQPTIHELFPRMLNALRPVGKEGHNTQQNYKFRSIDGIYDAVHYAEATTGVFHLPEVLERTVENLSTKSGGSQRLVTVKAVYRFFGPAGDHVTLGPVWGEGSDVGDKATSKAQTAALKYGLIHALCIPFAGDDDADASSPEFVANAPIWPGHDDASAVELGWKDAADMLAGHNEYVEWGKAAEDEVKTRAKQYKDAQGIGWPMSKVEMETVIAAGESLPTNVVEDEQSHPMVYTSLDVATPEVEASA